MFLDPDRLAAIRTDAFRAQRPYPWINPRDLIRPPEFERLRESLPPLSSFQRIEGKARKYGQRSHDRYVLDWRPGLELPEPWSAFIEELRGNEYRDFLNRLAGRRALHLRFHWHYTPGGCAVSPHCDAKRKLGSHIFYMNGSDDWNPAWGGETLILDDGGRFHSDSSPDFEDFDRIETARALDNHSLLFMRNGDSWHGVREIQAPEGAYRKVFIVVFEKPLAHHAHRVVSRIRGALRPG